MSQTLDEKADSDEMSSSNTPAASSAVERFFNPAKEESAERGRGGERETSSRTTPTLPTGRPEEPKELALQAPTVFAYR